MRSCDASGCLESEAGLALDTPRSDPMALSDEMRRLAKKWASGTGWPKRLEWLEVKGLRGWEGQRVAFQFPMVACSSGVRSGGAAVPCSRLQATGLVRRATP